MERNELVILAQNDDRIVGLAAALESQGDMVVSCLSDPGQLSSRIATRRPAALLVVLGEKADLFLDAVEGLHRPRPLLLAMGPEEDGRTVLRAMRLGARQYLPEDADADRVRACLGEAGMSGQAVGQEASESGHVVAVLGAKGGVGATLVASQLTLVLRELGATATLVDLNLRLGDAALYWDLQPAHTLADLEQREGPLDATWLRTVLQPHPSGAQLLAAPKEPEDAELVGAERVGEALGIACRLAEWTVLDLPRDFGEVPLRALDFADEILVVTTLEIPSLHHARSILGLLERLGLDPARVHLVLNRAERSGEGEVRGFLGRQPDARLPEDLAAAQEAASYGRPLLQAAPTSSLRKALDELASELHIWRGLERPLARPAPSPLVAALEWLRARAPWR